MFGIQHKELELSQRTGSTASNAAKVTVSNYFVKALTFFSGFNCIYYIS